MKNQKNSLIRKIFIICGVCLLVSAMVVLFSWQWGIYSSIRLTKECVGAIHELIPTSQGAALEERNNNSLATVSVKNEDFVGIIEFPRFESELPVCANWGNLTKYPCLFDGSIYNGSLKIGATSQKGQYDFYRDINVGDSVLFTDAEGNQYSLAIKDIRYEKSADETALNKETAPLVLFVKNVYAFEYIVIYCDVL